MFQYWVLEEGVGGGPVSSWMQDLGTRDLGSGGIGCAAGSGRLGSPVMLAKEPHITLVCSLTYQLGWPQRVTSDLCQNHSMWSTLYNGHVYIV